MKTTLTLCLALLLPAGAAQAQIFRSEAVNGAILGGIAGGIIGHNSGDLRHNGWKGAAIGATAGLLIGQAIGDARDRGDYVRRTPSHGYGYGHGHGGYVYRTAPTIHVGYGHTRYGYGHRHGGYWGHSGYGHYRSPWHRSSGWGVGVVYAPVYGRSYYDDYAYAPSPVAQPAVYSLPAAAPAPAAQPAPAAPQNVTIINNYYGTPSPMSGANSLFGR